MGLSTGGKALICSSVFLELGWTWVDGCEFDVVAVPTCGLCTVNGVDYVGDIAERIFHCLFHLCVCDGGVVV